MSFHAKAMVIGLGNDFRSDDSIGLRAARQLTQCCKGQDWATGHIAIQTHQGDATSLMALWEGAEQLILVDAVQGGGKPGERIKIDLNKEALPPLKAQVSTHGMGLNEAIELSKTLGDFPESAFFFGIECENFQAGLAISASLQESLNLLVDDIKQHLERSHA